MKIYVDGSSPKGDYPSAYCVFKGKKLIKSKVLDLNVNVYEIEFMALLEGLKLAEPYSTICSDNKEVVDEVNLKRSKKNKEFENTRELIKEKNLKVIKINRTENYAGIYLDARLKKLYQEGERVIHPKPNPLQKKLKRKRFYMKEKKKR